MFYEMHHLSRYSTLPAVELRVLEGLNVTAIKIPSMQHPTFYQLQLQKFRILGLTQYRRVFHLDSDVIPLANLDYLFEYSDWKSDVWKGEYSEPPLQENFVITSPNDPSNGGNFILTPRPGDLELINEIIQTKERNVAQGIPFDEKMGWGADIGMWNATLKHGFGWTFLAAPGDQGLLYYWTKYVKRRVSVMAGFGRLETWIPGKNGTVHLKKAEEWPIPPHNNIFWWPKQKGRTGVRKDFYHYMGRHKPWTQKLPDLSAETKFKNHYYYWQYSLMEVDKQFNVGINFTDLMQKKAVPYVLVQYQNDSHVDITNLLD